MAQTKHNMIGKDVLKSRQKIGKITVGFWKKWGKIIAKSRRSVYCTVCTQKVPILSYISN